MPRPKRAEKKILEKATDSDSLTLRAQGNRQFAANDFDAWVREILSGIRFRSVLDVCCGTGNQLLLYAAMPGLESLAGVDASAASLETASRRLRDISCAIPLLLKSTKMEEMFKDPDLGEKRYDLISCFYGLYYSEDPAKTLDEMVQHLTPGGSILVVGPHGENNASLFDLLERHFRLPEFVRRSSQRFMPEEVVPFLEKRCQVRVDSFINPIRYPDAESVLRYWRSSTFFMPNYEPAVRSDLESHFAKKGEFIVNKCVMACRGRRNS